MPKPQRPHDRDHERILTDKGRENSQRMGQKIMASNFRLPSRVLVSFALRTRQTAGCLSLASLPATKISNRLYSGDEQTYLDEICRQDTGSLLVIGHNPSVFYLLYRIYKADQLPLASIHSFPTASWLFSHFLPLFIYTGHDQHA